MAGNYGLSSKVLDQIITVFKGYSEFIEKVILFGSRARGDYKVTSDIDLAVKFKKDKHRLFQITNALDELNVIYSFDVVDYADVANQKLKGDIDKDGIVIFK
ncbi:nucleotidyltransferase domain-containing protein [Peptococcaceae bacterium 1198_IL3148]